MLKYVFGVSFSYCIFIVIFRLLLVLPFLTSFQLCFFVSMPVYLCDCINDVLWTSCPFFYIFFNRQKEEKISFLLASPVVPRWIDCKLYPEFRLRLAPCPNLILLGCSICLNSLNGELNLTVGSAPVPSSTEIYSAYLVERFLQSALNVFLSC